MNTPTPADNATQEGLLSRTLAHPLPRLVLELTLFFGILFALKSVIIKPGLAAIGLDGDDFQAWQGGLTIAAMFLVYFGLIRLLEKRPIHELPMLKLIPDGIVGISTGIAMISVVFGVLWIFGAYRVEAVGHFDGMVVSMIWVFMLAAMEEFLFRGIFYRNIEAWLGTVTALALSAGLFGAVHIPNESADLLSFLSVTSGGLLLGTLYSLTRRLWLPIFCHTSWNFAQAIYGSEVSGNEFFGTWLESTRTGPDWLSGGAFGVEKSVVTIGLIWIVLFLLFR